MIRFTLSLLLSVSALCASSNAQLLLRKHARVLTDAWASPEFIERRSTPDGPARMSYHFYAGNYHGGLTKDSSLQEFSVQEIAETLSREMVQQNFYPAESLREGDLMIIIHWGVTAVEQQWDDMFPESGDDQETEFDEEGIEIGIVEGEVSDLTTAKRPSTARNAQLTGINKGLRQKGLLPSDREELRSLLKEERYFIVLMAYDWQAMQKDKTNNLLWSCRFSLPSPGTNFVDAVPSLSRAAAPMMGTNLDELNKTKTQLGWGKGTVGEIEVLEIIEDEQENSGQ